MELLLIVCLSLGLVSLAMFILYSSVSRRISALQDKVDAHHELSDKLSESVRLSHGLSVELAKVKADVMTVKAATYMGRKS